jgi:cell division septum initiation protein DivIVA
MSIEILQAIDEIEALIEAGAPVPLSGKCMVNKAQALESVRRLRAQLPEAVADATRVADDRASIIMKAEAEAQRIIKGADVRLGELVDQHEIVSAAYKKANEIVSAAQVNAHEIKKGAYEYVEKLLEKAEASMQDTLRTIDANRKEIEGLRG